MCVSLCVYKVWENTAQILREVSDGDAVTGDSDFPSYLSVLFSFSKSKFYLFNFKVLLKSASHAISEKYILIKCKCECKTFEIL